MAIGNTAIKITDADFDNIKTSLKSYLSSRTDLLDYDFDSSVVNTLLNLLSYNTYHNAYWTNMAINESHLDSAQLRDNVVSRAKMLGYRPRSARGAIAELNLTIEPDDFPDSIIIQKNTKFETTIDGVTYSFVTPENYTIEPTANVYTDTISIVEGEPLTHTWVYNAQNPTNYIIPNTNVDTNSIQVKIKKSQSSVANTTYKEATDLTEVTGNSFIFFLEETYDQKHEISFGDGVIGNALDGGNIIQVSYRVCNGEKLNGANTFSGPSTISGYSDYSFDVTTAAVGGSEIESIESIKFTAPKLFNTQNRAVVKEDYERIILGEFSYVQSVSIWGGEENNPPTYGRVYVSAKPYNGLVLSQAQKDNIVSFLDKRTIFSIDTEFVDARYLYVVPTITVRYNSDLTTLSAQEIRTKVIDAISSYEVKHLSTFDKSRFEYSHFLTAIDNADPSIISNLVSIEMEKVFNPSITAESTYNIAFNNKIKRPVSEGHVTHSGHHFIRSSQFTVSGLNSFFDDDGHGILRIYSKTNGGSIVYSNSTAGVVDYVNGLVTINSFLPTSFEGDYVSVFATPNINDITSMRNQILLFSTAKITIVDSKTNTVAAKTTTATINGVEVAAIDSGINLVVY